MFLVENKIKERIKDIAKQGHSIDCAVAFWGIGAGNLFPADTKVRIICDLLSGGTNPFAIKILMDKGCEVKHLKNLHAKVYIGKNAALVTSANASTNGLGLENEEAKTIEAGYEVSDAQEVAKIQAWFNNKWNEAIEINEQDMEKARIAFSRNKRANNTIKIPENKRPFIAMLNNPTKYANTGVYVVVYEEGHSDESYAEIKAHIKDEQEQNPQYKNKAYHAYDVYSKLPLTAKYIDIFMDANEATLKLIQMPADARVAEASGGESTYYFGYEIDKIFGKGLEDYNQDAVSWGNAARDFLENKKDKNIIHIELGEFIEKHFPKIKL